MPTWLTAPPLRWLRPECCDENDSRVRHYRRDLSSDGVDVTVRHLERVEWSPYPDVDLDAWPFTVPVVRQLIDDGGLKIPTGVTVLLGESGSGKSTLIEVIAAIYPGAGFEASHARMSGPAVVADDDCDEALLRWHLQARTHPLASPAGFFLRAEVLHDDLDGVDRGPRQRRAWGDRPLLDRSHDETFLEVLRQRFTEPGFYLIDEPEAALSFTGCLGLITLFGSSPTPGRRHWWQLTHRWLPAFRGRPSGNSTTKDATRARGLTPTLSTNGARSSTSHTAISATSRDSPYRRRVVAEPRSPPVDTQLPTPPWLATHDPHRSVGRRAALGPQARYRWGSRGPRLQQLV